MIKKTMNLITESSYDVELYESKNKDHIYIAGIFSTADIMVANGRIYEKEILNREITKLTENQIKNKCCWGELGHPDSPELNLDKIAILIEDLSWKNKDVWGKALIIEDTPCGSIAKALVSSGRIGISSRGLGTVDKETKKVNEDYKLVTYDLVASPSAPHSWVNGIYEGATFDVMVEDSIKSPTDEEVKKALQEHKKRIWQVLENLSK